MCARACKKRERKNSIHSDVFKLGAASKAPYYPSKTWNHSFLKVTHTRGLTQFRMKKKNL